MVSRALTVRGGSGRLLNCCKNPPDVGRLKDFLSLSQAFERNQYAACTALQEKLSLTDEQLQTCYLEAAKYANHLC
jgi:hypothetical protein